MSFYFTDPVTGDLLEADADFDDNGNPVVYLNSPDVRIPLDRVEEFIAGIREEARQAAGADQAPMPAPAREVVAP